jgi:hypothetical protein
MGMADTGMATPLMVPTDMAVDTAMVVAGAIVPRPIADIDPKACKRYRFRLNQIALYSF